MGGLLPRLFLFLDVPLYLHAGLSGLCRIPRGIADCCWAYHRCLWPSSVHPPCSDRVSLRPVWDSTTLHGPGTYRHRDRRHRHGPVPRPGPIDRLARLSRGWSTLLRDLSCLLRWLLSSRPDRQCHGATTVYERGLHRDRQHGRRRSCRKPGSAVHLLGLGRNRPGRNRCDLASWRTTH